MDSDLNAARGSNLARQAFLGEHAPVARRLDHIADILDDRVDRAVCRAINEPPSYLTRVLGPLPTDGDPVGAWVEAATVIETYRLERVITDKRHALGREPRDPTERQAWREAAWEVEAIMTTPAVTQPESLERDTGIEIDL